MSRSTPQQWIRAWLVMLAMVPFLAVAGTMASATALESGALAALRAEALALVNETRRTHGLSNLLPDAVLDAAAQAHAEDMLERGYYDHESPDGVWAAGRYAAHGGGNFAVLSENLMRCAGCPLELTDATVGSFHRSWMGSTGHRGAILRPGVSGFGFGIAARDGVVYAVEMFVRPMGVPGGTQSVPASR